jgi:hypothetical protein
MAIRIRHGDVHLIDLQTRLPFKYGIATMTRAPQAFLRLTVEIDGSVATGIAADLLPPKWFTKVPEKPLDQEIDEMLEVIDHALACAVGMAGANAYDVWRQVLEAQNTWGRERGIPPLLFQFGTTFIERALIEAFCRAKGQSFAAAIRDNHLGTCLADFDKRLAGATPSELLPEQFLSRIKARHTVGLADPLEDSDIEPEAILNDGLPQSLAECIGRYGLRHFKIKLSGKAEQDNDRLQRVVAVIERNTPYQYSFSLDGNEAFRSLDSFREFWEALETPPKLSWFLEHLLFVEQPFHRDVALDENTLAELKEWSYRPRLIIDESDAEPDSFARALELGYDGTSHKNCKGIFKSIANRCLLEVLVRDSGNERLLMSGEDLANIGPVALLQDLAVAAALGISSIERNGHHYFAGLSAFPQSVQEQILEHHGDLYARTTCGWPSLNIVDGELNLESVIAAPLGVDFELDVSRFTPREKWKPTRSVSEGKKS